jgi:threonyl-tRNA synthetase
MFGPIEVEGQRFRLKPMNCPGHILIYRSEGRSYRDLPLRYSEFGTVYRFERSGTLHGLTRVRGFTQDDAHLFCTPEQLQAKFEQTADEAIRLIGGVRFRDRVFSLDARESRRTRPTRSPRTRSARRSSRAACRIKIDAGGGAFYGPKLDINVHDAIGRKWQLGTVQVDFVLPQRFDSKYRGSDGHDHRSRHDSPRARRFARAFLRRPDRALRRRVPGLARADSSGRRADLRASARLRAFGRERLAAEGFRTELDESSEKIGYKIRHWKTAERFPTSSSSANESRRRNRFTQRARDRVARRT